MNDVTRFSGMLTRMALDYARSSSRRRSAKPAAGKPKPHATEAIPTDETAVRAAMERALERHRQSRQTA